MGFSGTLNNGTPYPYYSHTTPIRIHKDMGVPGITLESVFFVAVDGWEGGSVLKLGSLGVCTG